MKENEIRQLIDKLEKSVEKEDSYFEFVHYDEEIEGERISANREGLKSYALELLKASFVKENTYSLKNFWIYEDVEFNTTEIRIVDKKRSEITPPPEYQETFKDKNYNKIFFIVIISIYYHFHCGSSKFLELDYLSI
ncbi:hypothetical protein [Wenyingzhuangia sp. IMCC45574]